MRLHRRSALRISRQFKSRVLPFRANRLGCSELNRVRTSARVQPIMLAAPLLPPISDRLNFHQTRKGAAEAARVGVTEEFRDFCQALIRIGEQAAGDLQPDCGQHFAVACAHTFEVTLQCAATDFQRIGGAIKGCVTLPQ
jgi:hypothetical protein